MFINTTSTKTINEYNSLRETQRPINIKSTSKELDEYVYEKKYKNRVNALEFLLINMGGFLLMKKNQLYRNIGAIALTIIADGALIKQLNTYNDKRQEFLKDENNKLTLYKQSGINVVV